MFDLTRSYFNDLKEREIAPGASITEEGMCLVYVSDGAGNMAVQPSAGSGSEIFAGFAITDALKILTEVFIETVTVPSAAPYTAQLKNSNIILASALVTNNTTTSTMAPVCPTPAATQYCLTTAGALTFNSAQAGNSVSIIYRYTLTAAQVLDKFHTRSVNNFAQDYFSSVSVGCLEGEIFTSMFDTSQAYTIGATINTGAGGLVTSAGGGVAVGIVSSLPSGNAPAISTFLGVKYKAAA